MFIGGGPRATLPAVNNNGLVGWMLQGLQGQEGELSTVLFRLAVCSLSN